MIELPEPFEKPAVPQKVYTEAWIKNLRIDAPSPSDKIRFHAVLVPYDSTTGEIANEGRVLLRCDDVITAMQTNNTLAAAFDYIVSTVNELSKDPTFVESFNRPNIQPPVTPAPDVTPAP